MFITRGTSLSRVYATCYPVAVTNYSEQNESDESVLENLEQDRLSLLLNALKNTILKQILTRMAKILEVGEVTLPRSAATQILKDLLNEGEREPYGIRGGTIIVTFNDRFGNSHKMGRFPLDASTTSTYHIHLTLVENRNFKVVLDNLVRKMTGVEPTVLIANTFKLEKRKLYRSSSSSLTSM